MIEFVPCFEILILEYNIPV